MYSISFFYSSRPPANSQCTRISRHHAPGYLTGPRHPAYALRARQASEYATLGTAPRFTNMTLHHMLRCVTFPLTLVATQRNARAYPCVPLRCVLEQKIAKFCNYKYLRFDTTQGLATMYLDATRMRSANEFPTTAHSEQNSLFFWKPGTLPLANHTELRRNKFAATPAFKQYSLGLHLLVDINLHGCYKSISNTA